MHELYAVDDPEYCEFLLGVYREVATRGVVAPLKASLRPVDKAYRMAGSLLLPLTRPGDRLVDPERGALQLAAGRPRAARTRIAS